jgi:hypothetical protein
LIAGLVRQEQKVAVEQVGGGFLDEEFVAGKEEGSICLCVGLVWQEQKVEFFCKEEGAVGDLVVAEKHVDVG